MSNDAKVDARMAALTEALDANLSEWRKATRRYLHSHFDLLDRAETQDSQIAELRAKVERLTVELAKARQLEVVNWDAMVEARRERDEALALLREGSRGVSNEAFEWCDWADTVDAFLAKHGRGEND